MIHKMSELKTEVMSVDSLFSRIKNELGIEIHEFIIDENKQIVYFTACSQMISPEYHLDDYYMIGMVNTNNYQHCSLTLYRMQISTSSISPPQIIARVPCMNKSQFIINNTMEYVFLGSCDKYDNDYYNIRLIRLSDNKNLWEAPFACCDGFHDFTDDEDYLICYKRTNDQQCNEGELIFSPMYHLKQFKQQIIHNTPLIKDLSMIIIDYCL